MGFFFKKKSGSTTPRSKGRQSLRKSLDSTLRDETLSDSSSTSKASLLESLMRKGKYAAAIDLVSNSQADDWNNDSLTDGSQLPGFEPSTLRPNTTTPLHVVAAACPPAHVVQSVVKIMKNKFHILAPEEFPDHMGRTALHLAVANGCEEELAEALCWGESLMMPAVYRDNMGRCALHWACMNKANKAKEKWNKKQVIFALLEHYPEGAPLKDKNGKTPVDYALQSKTSSQTMKILQSQAKLHSPKEEKPLGAKDEHVDVPKEFPTTSKTSKGFVPKWDNSKTRQSDDDVSTIGYLEAEMYNDMDE